MPDMNQTMQTAAPLATPQKSPVPARPDANAGIADTNATPPPQNNQQEPNAQTAIKLNDTQKRVLAKIVAAPTPKVAADEISNDQGLIAARDMLTKLGLITSTPGNATLTDQGTQAMKDYALVDDAGQLTDDGETLAHTDEEGKPEEEKPGVPPATSPLGTLPPLGSPIPPAGAGPETRMPPMESKYEKFAVLKHLMELSESNAPLKMSTTLRTEVRGSGGIYVPKEGIGLTYRDQDVFLLDLRGRSYETHTKTLPLTQEILNAIKIHDGFVVVSQVAGLDY